jgi:hypothetical protein
LGEGSLIFPCFALNLHLSLFPLSCQCFLIRSTSTPFGIILWQISMLASFQNFEAVSSGSFEDDKLLDFFWSLEMQLSTILYLFVAVLQGIGMCAATWTEF